MQISQPYSADLPSFVPPFPPPPPPPQFDDPLPSYEEFMEMKKEYTGFQHDDDLTPEELAFITAPIETSTEKPACSSEPIKTQCDWEDDELTPEELAFIFKTDESDDEMIPKDLPNTEDEFVITFTSEDPNVCSQTLPETHGYCSSCHAPIYLDSGHCKTCNGKRPL